MPKDRYTDRELALMAKAADALVAVMEDCDYRNLLYGKWSLLTEDVRQEHALRDKERAEMFVPPQRQFANLIRWNERRGWGFTDDDLREIERQVPPEPPPPEKDKLQFKARVLEVELADGSDGMPGMLRTFKEFLDILVTDHGVRPFHLFEMWPKMRVVLAPGLVHRPGLRWRTIDFGYGWGEPDPECRKLCGISPRRLPSSLERPHAGVLAAAAHFPLWLKRMDGRIVPYVWLPGYELENFPHGIAGMSERVIHHPRLTRCDIDTTMVYYGWDYVPSERDAVPVYAEIPLRQGFVGQAKTDP